MTFTIIATYKYFKENFIYFNVLETFKKEFNALTLILEKFFNSSVQLEITRIYYPFFDSNILAQLIALNGKIFGLFKILRFLSRKMHISNPNNSSGKTELSPYKINSLVSKLSGFKIKVAGRFYNKKIIPRKTVYTIQRGNLARGVIDFVDTSRYTNKSKRGSFSITITLSHIY